MLYKLSYGLMIIVLISVLVGLLWLGYNLNESFAEEPILITEANSIQNIDGKWSFEREWKESAYTGLSYENGGKLILRTAHDRNYIYLLVNHIGDTTHNKGEDRATVCLNSKNENPEQKNYCFIVIMDRKNSIVLQESLPYTNKLNFKRVFQTGFEGAGSITPVDRYSNIPHSTFEFKIPVDLVGQSNEYQMYVAVYEAQNNYILTWPRNIVLKNNFEIPNTSDWGIMISPDKSLPEFHFVYLVFCIPFLMIIVLRAQKWCKFVN